MFGSGDDRCESSAVPGFTTLGPSQGDAHGLDGAQSRPGAWSGEELSGLLSPCAWLCQFDATVQITEPRERSPKFGLNQRGLRANSIQLALYPKVG